MKHKTRLLLLATCLGVLLLCQVALVAAESEPKAGMSIGNVSFSAPISAEDATYLGLAKPAPFTLSDIKAPYVLVESFNTTCPHCMAQAPVLNTLYNKVNSDPSLKGKVKFLSVAQGQDQGPASMWKKFKSVPFAVVPDPDSKLGKAMNFSPYPVSLLVDKSGKVLWAHVGSFESANEAFTAIKKAAK
jgi:thiol-disulfide isomerase/thioredoxin